MNVKDIEFVEVSKLLQRLQFQAGLNDIGTQQVNVYKLTDAGLRAKQRTKALIEANQTGLRVWGKKPGRDEKMQILARSMFLSNRELITTCERHIAIITTFLEGKSV